MFRRTLGQTLTQMTRAEIKVTSITITWISKAKQIGIVLGSGCDSVDRTVATKSSANVNQNIYLLSLCQFLSKTIETTMIRNNLNVCIF